METNHPFITLLVNHELDKKIAKKWYKCVKDNLPSGVLGHVQLNKPNDARQNVLMIHKNTKKQHIYEVPLNRNLIDIEAQKIVEKWREKYNDDFDIQTSGSSEHRKDKPNTDKFTDSDFMSLCDEVGKHIHNKWYVKMLENGWRYGKLNSVQKTHPKLRKWEDLSPDEKDIDTEIPKLIFRELWEKGYLIVKKDILENILMKT